MKKGLTDCMVLYVADNDKEVVLSSQSAFANQRNRAHIFLSFIRYFFLHFSHSHLISLSDIKIL
jgi:hypothetical protein